MKRIIKRVTETWVDPGVEDGQSRRAAEDQDDLDPDTSIDEDGLEEDEPRPSRRRR